MQHQRSLVRICLLVWLFAINIYVCYCTYMCVCVRSGGKFPSIGSDDLGVENVKIQENSEKIRGPPGVP